MKTLKRVAALSLLAFPAVLVWSVSRWPGSPGWLAPGTVHAAIVIKSLSLNPYGALLSGGATALQSGYDGPIRLPANGSTPNLALGFVIPSDYIPNTALIIDVLFETPALDCNFELRPSFLFRARLGHPRDFGGASAGLEAAGASTPSTLTAGGIIMAAPGTAFDVGLVRFSIKPTPGEFQTLQPGDAVNFGIFREDRTNADSCRDTLGIAGISVNYTANQ